MIRPLTDHAIEKHVNCQQFETVDSFPCNQIILMKFARMCSKESTLRFNLDECVARIYGTNCTTIELQQK